MHYFTLNERKHYQKSDLVNKSLYIITSEGDLIHYNIEVTNLPNHNDY